MNMMSVGNGNVVLIKGGEKIYTDVAARFCRSEKDLESIIGTEYDKNLVKNILSSNHLAATEFDYFIFGIEGYSRVTEVQLVRKRIASYLIKSGRVDKHGKRSFDVVLPDSIRNFAAEVETPYGNMVVDPTIICSIIEQWYNAGVNAELPEEDLRYMKPQATEFKAIVGMNAHALLDWFKIRCCMNAQAEIRDLAIKMLALCKQSAPDLFEMAGPSCVALGYCPENARQNKNCSVITKDEALKVLSNYKGGNHNVFNG